MLNMYVKKLEKFAAHFSGRYCYATENIRTPYMSNVTFGEVIKKNKEGKDAYFYVNDGGNTKDSIKYINSLFVDLDAGKDSKGQYLKKSKVDIKKKAMLKKINAYPIKPHYVVETRNGYHVYWLVCKVRHTAETAKMFTKAELRLCEQLGGDTYVTRINQIMRLPYTTWCKTWSGKKDTHLTYIVTDASHNQKYSFKQLCCDIECVKTTIPQTKLSNQYSPDTTKIKHGYSPATHKVKVLKPCWDKCNTSDISQLSVKDVVSNVGSSDLKHFLSMVEGYFVAVKETNLATQARKYYEQL